MIAWRGGAESQIDSSPSLNDYAQLFDATTRAPKQATLANILEGAGVTPQLAGTAAGDGVTDDLEAFEVAAAASSDILIPAGTYALSDKWVLPDKTLRVRGAGKDNTILLFTGAAGGIEFSSTTSPTPEMSGFTLRSSVANQGTALYLTSSVSTGHDDKGGDLYSIETDQTGSGYWSDHFSFNNIRNLTASTCLARNATGATLYGAGYKFRGECTDIKLMACQAVSTEYYADVAGTCEGIQAYGMVGVDHRIGVKLNFAGGEPGFRFEGHLNCREKGVEMTNVIQSQFDILNYAYTAQAMPGWNAYEVNGASSADIHIQGLIHGTNYTGTRKGLVVNAGTRVHISSTFKDVDTAREYGASASLCTAQDCKYTGVTTEVSDAGTASTSLERRSTSSGWRMHSPGNNAIFEIIGGLSAALAFYDEGGSANSRKMHVLCDTDVLSVNSLNDDGTIKNQIARFNSAATSLGGTLNSEASRCTPVASQVNRLQVSGGASGTSPEMSAQGSGTNLNVRLTPKGTGTMLVPLANTPTYADDTAAGVGGLTAGQYYKTSVGALMIKL